MSDSEHDSLYIYKITLWHLLHLRMLVRYDTVYVTYVSRWYRLVSRVLTWIETTFLTPLNLRMPTFGIAVVPAGKDVPDFPSIEVDARQLVTDILLEDPPSRPVEHMESRFTREGAESFAIKSVAYYGGLFRFIQDVAKLEAERGGVDYLQQPHFLDRDLGFEKSNPVTEDGKLLSLYLSYYQIKCVVGLGIRLLSRVGSASDRQVDATDFVLTSEVGNVEYVEGSAGQADYLLQSDRLDTDDVLFYRTSHPLVTSVENDETLAEFGTEDRHFVDLREVTISLRRYGELLRYVHGGDFRSLAEISTVARSVPVAVEFGALFARYDVDHNVALTFSNDMRKVRLDSGLITGVAELHGVHNVDYQTRPFYFNSFEHLCNRHHTLYIWSEDWVTDPKYFSFVDRIVPVGNVFTEDEPVEETDPNLVSVFSTDVNVDGRNTLAYNVNFVTTCLELAASYPDYQFVLKPKFQRHTDQLMANLPEFPENFAVEEGLYDTEELVSQSSVVLAIGFTSPGIDAIMREKDTIIYSELGDVPDPLGSARVVCESHDDVVALFDAYADGDHIDAEFVDRLDPYRDGKAYDRIVADLLT